MKPDTATAMRTLIEEIRQAIPFDTPIEKLCDGPCTGCSKKLMEYLDMELEDNEQRLSAGEIPTFGDINKLVKISRKVYTVLQRNNLVDTMENSEADT